jgi:hypothetical protein
MTPLEFTPAEVRLYADQLEREFYRAGLSHLYEAIVNNADLSENPDVIALSDEIESLKDELTFVKREKEDTELALDDALQTIAEVKSAFAVGGQDAEILARIKSALGIS